MKKLIVVILFITFSRTLFAQNHIGVTLRLDASKTWKLNKKTRVELGQQFQLNPELNRDQKKFGDIFNEINLFPDDDSDDDGKDDGDDNVTDDDDANNSGSSGNINQPLGSLNDKPYNVLLEWRSATNARIDYNLTKWLRLGQSYTLNVRKGGDLRHALQTNVTFVEKTSKIFEFSQRIGFQYTSREKKGKTVWEEDLVARTGFEWDFKPKHSLETTVGVNGAFDNKVWEWDRLRVDVGLSFEVTKVQSFEFGYRFQRTLDKKALVSHGVNFSYVLEF